MLYNNHRISPYQGQLQKQIILPILMRPATVYLANKKDRHGTQSRKGVTRRNHHPCGWVPSICRMFVRSPDPNAWSHISTGTKKPFIVAMCSAQLLLSISSLSVYLLHHFRQSWQHPAQQNWRRVASNPLVGIFITHDIILPQIRTCLYFNQNQGNIAEIF